MTEERSETSETRLKLASPRGTVLGSVTVPGTWPGLLRRDSVVHFQVFEGAGEVPRAEAGEVEQRFKVGALMPSCAIKGAVELSGVTLEEFELVQGCSFCPGAAYLRSLAEYA